MARTGRFAFERLEVYHAAHSLHALCRRIRSSLPRDYEGLGQQAEHFMSMAVRSIARSSTDLTRRRAVTHTRAAHHAVEDGLHYLRIIGRRQLGDAAAVMAATELGERLLTLVCDRLHTLRRAP
jgi:hypothetical protein